ncbi:MAG: hypothetical protein SOZ00_07930 [Tidjanibacter sp.]|nr:hypothetical protein [Tidjanibacter sp.]
MPKPFLSLCLNSLMLLAAVAVGVTTAAAQRSDLELLRGQQNSSEAVAERSPYGLQPGKQTISPLYHLFSATFYLWQNDVAPDVATRGGYALSNPDYFKALYGRYGLFRSFFYGVDRAVRNTKIGRVGYNETFLLDNSGMIVDEVERYHCR